jgi:AraC-like DNA-binding protein
VPDRRAVREYAPVVPAFAYRERPAPSVLEPWLECAWQLTIDHSRPAHVHRVLPDGCIDLVWTAGTGLILVGPNSTAFTEQMGPGASALGVRMHPGGAPALLAIRAPELLDARVRPSEIWGARGERLEDDVARAGTPERQASVLLRWLAAQARGARAPDPVVAALRSRLPSAGVPIAALARELGYGERQLRRRVIAEVGYGPKQLARVLRLRRTLAAARRGVSVAELAYLGGYADQAHLCHECSALAGTTPSALLAS